MTQSPRICSSTEPPHQPQAVPPMTLSIRPAVRVVGHAAAASRDDVDAPCGRRMTPFPPGHHCPWPSVRPICGMSPTSECRCRGPAARARLLTREHGKTLFETNIEVTRLVDRLAQVAGFADSLQDEDTVSGKMFDTVITRKSRGVSPLIVPWNWLLATFWGRSYVHALLAGNTVVIKLSEFATLAPAQTIMKIAAMLPPGVVDPVTGDGTVIGDDLVTHPLVRQVNFTGSIRVGRHVMQKAAENITPVTLELAAISRHSSDDAPLSPNSSRSSMSAAF